MTEGARSRWYLRFSLRMRMLLIAAAVTAIVMVLGGTLLLSILRSELIETARDDGLVEARRIAAMAEAGALPTELPRTGDLSAAIQVVQDGAVISGTPNALNRPRLLQNEPRRGKVTFVERDELPIGEHGPFHVIVLGTTTPNGDVTVYVAVDVEDVEDFVSLAGEVGGFGLFVLVVTLSGVFWVVIGRTLAPVSAIQKRADAITGSELHQRVPEPVGHDEISDLARTINEMLGRLETSAKRQEAFVADAAHELRTPIASLQARLETILGHESPADVRSVRDLLGETARMRRLVDHLLLLSRSDAGTISAARIPVDLDDVIRDAVSSTGPTTVPVDVSGVEPVQIHGQPSLLEHVVTNLLDNAQRYARSTIDVSLHANEHHAVLTVDDDGPGIPEPLRDDVLQRFFRVDESRERGTGGAGLGLAIVSEIVRVHSGEVDITDSPAGGARVRVLLPLG